MDADTVREIVRNELARDEPSAVDLAGAVGVPWPSDKVKRAVDALRQSLVTPYLRHFELKETFEQIRQSVIAEYWVVAETPDYFEWYDPINHEFGLAAKGKEGGSAVSIGVRGDLVGVFCAI